MAAVSDRDRQAMARQARALAQLERDEGGDDATRDSALAAADRDREAMGLPPLKTEVEFHRKAVERGLISR
jgi:hypothetical protein